MKRGGLHFTLNIDSIITEYFWWAAFISTLFPCNYYLLVLWDLSLSWEWIWRMEKRRRGVREEYCLPSRERHWKVIFKSLLLTNYLLKYNSYDSMIIFYSVDYLYIQLYNKIVESTTKYHGRYRHNLHFIQN